jgi:mono/diheme cytochrome c family protein
MRRSVTLRRGWTIAAVAAIGLMAWSSGVAAQDKPAATAAKPAGGGVAARGKYLVTVIDCGGCHTPLKMSANGPEPDETRMMSGHPGTMKLPPPPAPGVWAGHFPLEGTAFAGPWGISYPANLTPDKETGLGSWTEQQFMDTIRTGRHQGRGREILPPMPWKAFRNLTDPDLKAIFAYLRTIPAVNNKVPDPVIAGPPKK